MKEFFSLPNYSILSDCKIVNTEKQVANVLENILERYKRLTAVLNAAEDFHPSLRLEFVKIICPSFL